MQTEHYMSNMGKPGRAEQRGLERVDDLAGREQRQVVAALGLAPGRSAEAGPGGGRTQSEPCFPLGPPTTGAARLNRRPRLRRGVARRRGDSTRHPRMETH